VGPVDAGVGLTEGRDTLAGHIMSAEVAALGPEVMFMQPGSFEIMPRAGSLIKGGC